MRRLGGALLALALTFGAAHAAPDLSYRPVASAEPLKDANFYVLTLLDETPAAREAVTRDKALAALDANVRARARAAARACETRRRGPAPAAPEAPSLCSIDQLRWTEAERAEAETAVAALYDKTPAIRRLVDDHMRKSGYFGLHEAKSDKDLFLAAWKDAHAAIDRIHRIYGHGETPSRFADIDSIIYPADGGYYRGLMANTVRDIEITMAPSGVAYDLPLRLALDLMDINRRDDAVRQRRLEDSENAKTYAAIPSIRWSDYPYATILIPGYSPEIAYEPLNPGAKLRIKRGVEMWRAKQAPLLIVSGGQLRPIGTQYVEALEMKTFIMAQYGVPEEAILIDPIARHTTTNMRNAARLIYRHGIPADKLNLVAGNSVPNIASEQFKERCIRELGYVPFEAFKRVSFDGLEWKPRVEALHLDAQDPMDP